MQQLHLQLCLTNAVQFLKSRMDQFYNRPRKPNLHYHTKYKNYELFTNLIQNIARKHTSRGCRTRYVPCLNEGSLNMLDKYKKLYKEDPFAEDTITAGEQLMASTTQERQRKWLDTIESMDMSRNSKKAWNLIRKLNNNPAIPKHQHCPVTANQVAHQLLINGQTKEKKVSRVKFRKKRKTKHGTKSNITIYSSRVL